MKRKSQSKNTGLTYNHQLRILGFLSLLILVTAGAIVGLLNNRVSNMLAAQPELNPIVLENQKPGTTEWQSPNFESYSQALFLEEQRKREYSREEAPRSDSGGDTAQGTGWQDTETVKGYANPISINAGETIDLHFSSKEAFYDFAVYRIGWYGGSGGSFVMSQSNLPGVDRGVPNPDPITGRIEADWPVSYTIQTNQTWTTGVYLVWVSPSNDPNDVSYILFVVRDDSSTADVLFQVPLSTYQAYNAWGGKSLYEYNSINGRSYEVSFDRPFDQNDGAGSFFPGDYHMIRWLEKEGYNVAYATSMELESNPNLMANHKIFLSNYHDEYWSKPMRDHITIARDQGKHLAFFDANNIYWQIRYDDSSTGDPNRVIIGYKDETLDPMSSSGTPELTTVLWRDPIVNQPENELLGIMFDNVIGYGEHTPWVVSDASHWIYNGTSVQNGDEIPTLIGYEFDRIYNNGLTPGNLEVISHSPVNFPQLDIVSHANGSVYTAPGGGMVFAAGTNYWSYLLEGNWIWQHDTRVEQMTRNILDTMIISSQPNNPPDAVDNTINTDEDTPQNIDVLGNDSDPDGDTVIVTSASDPANGTTQILPNDQIRYTPDANFNGQDSFTYDISDGRGGTDTATVTVNVNPVNDAPDAVDDSVTTNTDTQIIIDVLSNDTDVDLDILDVTNVSTASKGTVAIIADETVTYTPNNGETGIDSFTYDINDGNGGTDSATVTVTIDSIGNDPPNAVDDTATTDEDVVGVINVLSNDTDVELDPLNVTGASNPPNGTAVVNGDNTITYTPDANFNGQDSFTYDISDGNGGTDSATVIVTVNPINDVPDAVNDAANIDEDTATPINVLSNDTDVDLDTLNVIGASNPSNGTAVVNGDNTITYTPNPNYSGTDSFTYDISDGNGGTDTTTVNITVGGSNDPPVAVDDTAQTDIDVSININVLSNDSDPDTDDTLNVVAVQNPTAQNGTAIVNGDNTIAYTPPTGFVGEDTFTYTISDGIDTANALVTVAVVDPNLVCTPLYRINAGGGAVNAIDGGPNWQPQSAYPSVAGLDDTSTATISNLPAGIPEAIFQTNRWHWAGMNWSFPIAEAGRLIGLIYTLPNYSGATRVSVCLMCVLKAQFPVCLMTLI